MENGRKALLEELIEEGWVHEFKSVLDNPWLSVSEADSMSCTAEEDGQKKYITIIFVS